MSRQLVEIFSIFLSDVEKAQDLEVRIENVMGEVLYLQQKEKFVGAFIKQIDLAKTLKSIYFLEIETSDGIVNKKNRETPIAFLFDY